MGTPQGELFKLDSPLVGEVRGERSLMAFPFFALSKNAWMKPLAYATPTVSIEVRPSARGVATIYDKEIVLYIPTRVWPMRWRGCRARRSRRISRLEAKARTDFSPGCPKHGCNMRVRARAKSG